jgi:23S rRNA pseudouridine2605 synthase
MAVKKATGGKTEISRKAGPHRPKGRAKRAGAVTRVHLNRAMSKLGMLSRSQATEAILEGRVRVDGRVVVDPAAPIDPGSARIQVDGKPGVPSEWRTILLNKPRGVVSSRRDAAGRRTVYDMLKEDGEGLVPVGQLDAATSGLLLMTTDAELAAWITDPDNAVQRLYLVTVRGKVTPEEAARLEAGITQHGELTRELRAAEVVLRKASNRESHLTVALGDGGHLQARRLFDAIGHEVTRLKQVTIAGLELGALEPGQWREVGPQEIGKAFPALRGGRKPIRRRATRDSS